MTFDRSEIQAAAADLVRQGIYVGTSSWKYPGWCGQVYTADRYVYRGRFAETRFNQLCLAEYAEVFKTVCVDAAYYKFPSQRYLEGMISQVPPDFRFGFKVTDEITIKRFSNLPRFGPRAGNANENFLNADLFASAFLEPCAPFRDRIGLLIFEFSRFYPADFARGRDFVQDLDTFFSRVPSGWPYGVEIRNRRFLHPEYFALLRRHGVAHILNSWQAMPSVGEQLAMDGSLTEPSLTGARFLLRPGRKYEEAVKQFEPYDRLQDPNPEGRAAAAELIRQRLASGPGGRTFIYVNNRFEGNAPLTIAAILEQASP